MYHSLLLRDVFHRQEPLEVDVLVLDVSRFMLNAYVCFDPTDCCVGGKEGSVLMDGFQLK